MIKKLIIYTLLAALAYWYISKYIIEKGKYVRYLKELGFNIVDKMSFDEIKTSYIYLHDYARRYGTNGATILRTANPSLFVRAQAISDKYKLFNLA